VAKTESLQIISVDRSIHMSNTHESHGAHKNDSHACVRHVYSRMLSNFKLLENCIQQKGLQGPKYLKMSDPELEYHENHDQDYHLHHVSENSDP